MERTERQKKLLITKINKMIKNNDFDGLDKIPKDVFADRDIVSKTITDNPKLLKYISPEMDKYISYINNELFIAMKVSKVIETYSDCCEVLSELPSQIKENERIIINVLDTFLQKNKTDSYNQNNIEILKTIPEKALTKKVLAYLYVNSWINKSDIEESFNEKSNVIREFRKIEEKLKNAKSEFDNSDLHYITMEYAYDFVINKMSLSEVDQTQAFESLIATIICDPKISNETTDVYEEYFRNTNNKEIALQTVIKDVLLTCNTSDIAKDIACFMGKYMDKELTLIMLDMIGDELSFSNCYDVNPKILADKDVFNVLIDKLPTEDTALFFNTLDKNHLLNDYYVSRLLDKDPDIYSLKIFYREYNFGEKHLDAEEFNFNTDKNEENEIDT